MVVQGLSSERLSDQHVLFERKVHWATDGDIRQSNWICAKMLAHRARQVLGRQFWSTVIVTFRKGVRRVSLDFLLELSVCQQKHPIGFGTRFSQPFPREA